ncbi:hypothetical protein [Bacillus sp. Marseille-Q3570]|nr:hypothetical protein [Bacillus sp. Marseille-Q3570]
MPTNIKKKISCYTMILNFFSLIDDQERDEILQKLMQRNPHS